MAIDLDHVLIPSRNRDAGARTLARILGVRSAPAAVGPFTAVHVNGGLTLDFDEWQEDFPKGHYFYCVIHGHVSLIGARAQQGHSGSPRAISLASLNASVAIESGT